MSNLNQNNIAVGISQKALYTMEDFYATNMEGFLDRYKDFIKSPSPLQIEFAKEMFNLIVSDIDTSNVTVIPGRCGISKSIFISSLMNYFTLFDNYQYRGAEAIGMIVVTDQLERLRDYQSSPKHLQSIWGEERGLNSIKKYSTYISSATDKNPNGKNAMELLVEAQYKPIVLLSTQRYFSMSDEQRETLFHYCYINGNQKIKLNREILIFDEKPYFSDTLVIDVGNFNNVSTALQNGIPESALNRDNKDWMLQEYRKFRDKMENLLREKEKTSAIVDRFYWRDVNTDNVTLNDERFFELVKKYKTSIAKEYPSALTDLRAFKSIMTDGAFFTTRKQNQYQEYKTYFELYRDNRDKFYLGKNKVKCFVFDATADVDPDYKTNYVKMIDCSKYNIPLNLTISFFDTPSSKSRIVNNNMADGQIKAICEIVKQNCYHKGFGNTLIVTYSQIEGKFKYPEFDVVHFGNVKGTNDFVKLNKLAHIGNNRFDPFGYFVKLLTQNPKMLEQLKEMVETTSREFINSNSKIVKGIFENDSMNDIMFSSILADFEQNIFRTAIRNFNNERRVNVYTFWNCTTFETLNSMIQERYGPYDVQFKYMGIPELIQKTKTENRKTKNGIKTNPQKILEWYDRQEKGRIFKLSEMLSDLNITNKQFQKAKEKNSIIQSIFINSTTEKQGYYEVG